MNRHKMKLDVITELERKEILEGHLLEDWERKFSLWNEYMNGTSIYDTWDKRDSHDRTAIAGDFWYKVTRCGYNNSGYVSFNAKGLKKKTPDHFVSPRMWWLAMMDTNRELMKDEALYAKSFYDLRTIVWLTSKENEDARYINTNGEIKVPELTVNKYKKIRWLNSKTGNYVPKGTFALENLVPDWFTEYEKKYLNEVI